MLFKSVFKRKIKGYIGEYQVLNELKMLSKSKYHIFNDVRINNSNGSSSQIDHVVVSHYGIFVIETKNYKGIIKGTETSKDWNQILNQTNRKFYNPISQNQGHIYALKYLLRDLEEVTFHSIIVFTTKASLKVNTTTTVVYSDELIKTIKKHKIKTINPKTKALIIDRLKNPNTVLNNKIVKESCPNCGNSLIHRIGKFGKFIGCTNYPICHFTKN